MTAEETYFYTTAEEIKEAVKGQLFGKPCFQF